MVLLEDRREGEPRKRVYRVVYGKDVSLKWNFALDTEGKILDVQYEWE